MGNARTISILFAFNSTYAQHGAACIASLLRHSESNLEVTIASTEDCTKFSARFHRSFEKNPRIKLRFVQWETPDNTQFPTPYTLTKDAYLRLWAHDILPNASRVLYLDPDTIATSSIEPLWDTDLKGSTVGAVPIPNSSRPLQHGMSPGSLFFNSGVLLIDLSAWRKHNYCSKCLELIRLHPERAIDADQDILNLCLVGDWLPLDYKWNVINPFFRPSHNLGLSPTEVSRIRSEAAIIHYNGGAKPWIYLDNHPRQNEYFINLAETDWCDYRPSDKTPLNICRKAVTPYVPLWARNAVKKTVRRVSPLIRRTSAA